MSDNEGWTVVSYARKKKGLKKPTLANPLPANSIHSEVRAKSSVPKRYTTTASDLKKLEDVESGKEKVLSVASRASMAAARTAKGLTQKQLDLACAFPYNMTNAFEAGRLYPTRVQMQNIQRVLGVQF
jgi:ribosome-binding protein aMBF1 (putative translation factor)